MEGWRRESSGNMELLERLMSDRWLYWTVSPVRIRTKVLITQGHAMSEQIETIELELRPIPPDTTASVKQEIMPLIETAFHQAGQPELLTNGQVEVEIERTFPTDEAIVVGLTFLAGIGLETYKVILEVLRERYEVKERSRSRRSPKEKRSRRMKRDE